MNFYWYDVLGITGVILVLAAYFLLQAGRVMSDRWFYQLANAVGAAFILVSLLFDFNLSAFLMEAAWLGVSIYGIARVRRTHDKAIDKPES